MSDAKKNWIHTEWTCDRTECKTWNCRRTHNKLFETECKKWNKKKRRLNKSNNVEFVDTKKNALQMKHIKKLS